ncbi:MAG: hypothetical protein AB7Q37_18205 [Pyrinomonadaceae bacterium]
MKPLAGSATLVSVILALSCFAPNGERNVPSTVIWAWERPEDLRFLDPGRHAVAFLAQTLILKNDSVEVIPRRQPLAINPGSYVIAVTRIESSRRSDERPSLSTTQREAVIVHLQESVKLPEVRAIQVDFDAVASEREFYRTLIIDTRSRIGPDLTLTITALASWCSGDRWLVGLPIDDAVPMLFDIGPQRNEILRDLKGGTDWNEPLCRNSYGVSVNEPPLSGLKPGRRIYLFKDAAWNADDLARIDKIHEN